MATLVCRGLSSILPNYFRPEDSLDSGEKPKELSVAEGILQKINAPELGECILDLVQGTESCIETLWGVCEATKDFFTYTEEPDTFNKELWIQEFLENYSVKNAITDNAERVVENSIRMYNFVAKNFHLPKASEERIKEIVDELTQRIKAFKTELLPLEEMSCSSFLQLLALHEKISQGEKSISLEQIISDGKIYIQALKEQENAFLPNESVFQEAINSIGLDEPIKSAFIKVCQEGFNRVKQIHEEFADTFPGISQNHYFKERALNNKDRIVGLVRKKKIPQELHAYVAYVADSPREQKKLFSLIERLQWERKNPAEIRKFLEIIVGAKYRKEVQSLDTKYTLSIPLLNVLYYFNSREFKELDHLFLEQNPTGYIDFIKREGNKKLYSKLREVFTDEQLSRIAFSRGRIFSLTSILEKNWSFFSSMAQQLTKDPSVTPENYSKKVGKLINASSAYGGRVKFVTEMGKGGIPCADAFAIYKTLRG